MKKFLILFFILSFSLSSLCAQNLTESVFTSAVATFENSDDDMLYESALSIINAKELNGREAEAVSLLERSSDVGNIRAKALLGSIYLAGLGKISADAERAVGYLEDAAEKGDASAQYNLATCYENGIGVKEDLDKAVELLKLSAEAGNIPAKEHLETLGVSEPLISFEIIGLFVALIICHFLVRYLLDRHRSHSV